VSAARLAAAGISGPPTVLEGRFGFFQAYCGDTYDEAALLGELGERWELEACFVKPYPTNVFTHTGIDAALALRERGLAPEDVASVRIGVAGATLRTIAQPRDSKIRPESGYHAQFSGPFTFALALRGGGGLGVYLDDFSDDAVRDPLTLEVAARVTHEADPRCEQIFPMQFPSIVRVTTKDGRELVEEVLANRGTAQRPLSASDVERKYSLNARRLGADADVLAERIGSVRSRDDVRGLLDLG
jgi:2-methylcitrate dehydratase PrpD